MLGVLSYRARPYLFSWRGFLTALNSTSSSTRPSSYLESYHLGRGTNWACEVPDELHVQGGGFGGGGAHRVPDEMSVKCDG